MIKIFTGNIYDIENNINKFIKDKILYDIKFSSTFTGSDIDYLFLVSYSYDESGKSNENQ